MVLDEHMEHELNKRQKDWDNLDREEKERKFHPGKQLLHIEDFRLVLSKKDNTPISIFTVAGAEEDNKGKTEDLFFYMSSEKRGLARLRQFLGQLGIDSKLDLTKIDEIMEQYKFRVFEGEVTIKPGTDRDFVNVRPLRWVSGDDAEGTKETKDLPF
jgi:hypothetical protein